MVNIPFISSTKIISFPRPGRVSDLINSRLRSLDVDRELVEVVLSEYGFDLAGGSKNLPNARRNTNLIIETEQGKKIFKKYREDWKQTTIEFEHSILRELSRLDFKAPRLASTKSGETWITIQNQNYCLFDFIKGENYSSRFLYRPHRVRMMATAGKTLAELHKRLIGFQPTGQHHLGFKSLSGDRVRNIPWHERMIEELVEWSSRIELEEDRIEAEVLIQSSKKMFEQIVDLDEKIAKADLPRIIIHGDYGLHNLIYEDVDHAIPVDYELSRIEWRMSDLVSVISKFRYKDGSYDFESITQFLHAYQWEFPIDDDEWNLFPFVWKYYKLRKSVQYWISYFETDGPVRKLRSSKDELEHSNWALEHPERVIQFKVSD